MRTVILFAWAIVGFCLCMALTVKFTLECLSSSACTKELLAFLDVR